MINRSNPDTSDITTRVIKSTFVTGGDTCSAMLHVPEGTGDTQLPGILMVGGWGSVQQALTISSQRKPMNQLIQSTPWDSLYVLPAHAELETLEAKLESRYKIYKLKEMLQEQLKEFDCIFIDTPPALNFFSRSALIGSDRCLIPFDCDAFSRQALTQLLDSIAEMREDHNPDLSVEGIVVNQMQPQAKLPQMLVQELIDDGHPVLPVHLMSSVKMRESHQLNTPLIHYVPKHKLTGQFVELFKTLQQ